MDTTIKIDINLQDNLLGLALRMVEDLAACEVNKDEGIEAEDEPGKG